MSNFFVRFSNSGDGQKSSDSQYVWLDPSNSFSPTTSFYSKYKFSNSVLLGYSVAPKYEFVLRGKGIVERVAGTFSGCCQ